MGHPILALVLEKLREAGFSADAAYPGRKYAHIRETVAAVHIAKADRANRTVTVEVSVLCPGEMGGTACELAALRAAEVLSGEGAGCVQGGCDYDSTARVYRVKVLASFTGVAGAEDWALGPGFSVYIDNIRMPHAVSFTGEKAVEREVRYVIGEDAPAGITAGKVTWSITLEELIPAEPGAEAEGEPFALRVERSTGGTEVYSGCCWTGEKRSYTQAGLRRTRTGFALEREEG